MSYVITEKITLETEDCPNCGVVFAMPTLLIKKRREDGGDFYCPNGHSMHYGNNLKTQNEKLKQQIAGEQRRAEAAQRETERVRRSLAAQKGQVTRLKNRAANGVCPCCNRYFANVHRHMTSQHPEFAQQEEVTE